MKKSASFVQLALLCAVLLAPGCRAMDAKYVSFPLNSIIHEHLYWDHALAHDPEAVRLREHDIGPARAATVELVIYHTLLPVGWLWTAFDLALLPFTLAHDDDFIDAPSQSDLEATASGTVAVGVITNARGYVYGYWLAAEADAVEPGWRAFHECHDGQIGDPTLHVARIESAPWREGLLPGLHFDDPRRERARSEEPSYSDVLR